MGEGEDEGPKIQEQGNSGKNLSMAEESEEGAAFPLLPSQRSSRAEIKRLLDAEGRAVWSREDLLPSAQAMASVAAEDLGNATLVTLQLSSHAELPSRLDWLVCGKDPEREGGLSRLENANVRRICGKVFEQGGLAWNCRTCQMDATCVQCDACFHKSDHTGHEVYFHRTSPGGCCDCGDIEAWAESGCCPDHRPVTEGGGDKGQGESDWVDPLSVLSPQLLGRGKVVLAEVLEYMALYAGACAMSFEVSDAEDDSPHSILVHNDDVHTYEDVTVAFRELRMSHQSAVLLTQEVDERGSAIVATKRNREEAEKVAKSLRDRGLLVSVAKDSLAERADVCLVLLNWLLQLSSKSDGLCRLVCLQLLEPLAGEESLVGGRSELLAVSESVRDEQGRRYFASDLQQFSYISSSSLLPLLLCSDPLLPKAIRHAAHLLYMQLLVDSMFKREFALAFAVLYRNLSRLYVKGIGPASDSILGFSVQIFTTPSLVRALSDVDACVSSPMLPKEYVWSDDPAQGARGLQAAIMSALAGALDAAGLQDEHDDSFLDHAVVGYRRFSPAFRDMEYVLQAADSPNHFTALEDWLKLLGRLQNMNGMVRRVGNHEEYSSPRWMGAFSISLSVATVSEVMIDCLVSMLSSSQEQGAEQVSSDAERLLARSVEMLRSYLNSRQMEDEFDVLSGKVSLHIPLNRFVSKMILSVAEAPEAQRVLMGWALVHPADGILRGMSGRHFVELPLRALAFHGQVMSRLWVRNGSSAGSAAMNYACPPFCKQLRDLDLAAVQIGALVLDRDELLLTAIKRFSLLEWLQLGGGEPPPATVPADSLVHLAEEFFALVIMLVAELPGPPGSANRRLRKELVHRLAAGPKTYSDLSMVASGMFDVPEAELDQLLHSISEMRESPGGGANRFHLSPAIIDEYDPTFYHLSRAEHQAADDAVADSLGSRGFKGSSSARPVVPPPQACHPVFEKARLLLGSTVLITACRAVLDKYLEGAVMSASTADETREPSAGRVSVVLFARIVHVLTLQLHCCSWGKGEMTGFEECIHRLEACAARDPAVGPIYEPGIRWVLQEGKRLCGLLPGAAGGDVAESVAESASASKSLEDRKKMARQRALDAMAKQQAAFAAQMEIDDDLDDSEHLASTEEQDLTKITCIMCHEKSDKLLGYIGLAQRSSVLSTGILANPSHSHLKRKYVIVSKAGCQVRSSAQMDSPCVCIVPCGVSVVAEEIVGRRVRISQPCSGWLSMTCANGRPLLQPAADYSWRKWGRQRVHLSLCGHAVHYDCWDAYFVLMLQRSESNQQFDGRMSLDVNRMEFLCPLCKGLSNVLIPHLPCRAVPGPLPWNQVVDWVCRRDSDNGDGIGECLLATLLDRDSAQATESWSSRFLSPARTVPAADAAANDSGSRSDLQDNVESFVGLLHRLCTGVDLASCPPWSNTSITGINKWMPKHQDGSQLRMLFLLWSTLGHSVAASEAAERRADNVDSVGDCRGLHRFGASLQHSFRLLDHEQRQKLSRGLVGILSGEQIELSKSVEAVRTLELPLHSVWDPFWKDDAKQIEKFLCSQRADATAISSSGVIDPTWPILSMPLLSWDLTMLTAGLTAFAGAQPARLLCLARLAQLLLQPEFCALGMADIKLTTMEDDEESKDACADALHSLRAELAACAGVEVSPSAPTGDLLLREAYAAWLPFLRTSVLLIGCCSVPQTNPGSSCNAHRGILSECLASLDLPDPVGIIGDVKTLNLMRNWAKQYAAVFGIIGGSGAASPTDSGHQGTPLFVSDFEGHSRGIALTGEARIVIGGVTEEGIVHDDGEIFVDLDGVAQELGFDILDAFAVAANIAQEQHPELAGLASEESDDDSDADDSEDSDHDMQTDSSPTAPASSSADGTPSADVPSAHGLAAPGSHSRMHQRSISPVIGTLTGTLWPQSRCPIFDLSHGGYSTRDGAGLIDLPRSYVELYSGVKTHPAVLNHPEYDPAVCLVCGAVVLVGHRAEGRNCGECTFHARQCGGGIGVFFIVQKCTTLLVRDSRSVYHPSLYLDQHGEEDTGLRRGRPLYLNDKRYTRLQHLYLQHRVAQEVTSRRCAADRVIRDNFN